MRLLNLSLVILILRTSPFAFSQNNTEGFGKKINLDDVKIKGEVNQGQSMLNRRTRMNLDSRIKIPTNFRKAILENLEPELEGISKLNGKGK